MQNGHVIYGDWGIQMTEFNNEYHVIEGAGYSIDGKRYYVDSRIERFMKQRSSGKALDVYKPLLVHETTEKHYETTCGYSYQRAHELATGMEKHWIKASGYDWDEYQGHILREIKKLDISGPVPPDLDLKPDSDYHAVDTILAFKRLYDKQYPGRWNDVYNKSGDLSDLKTGGSLRDKGEA